MNYVLHCQGCHLEDGSATGEEIPALTEAINFLTVPGGREFLIQVPGVANAPVSDQELTQLLNWVLKEFSLSQLPENFLPYTVDEVHYYRNKPLDAVKNIRKQLLDSMTNL